MASAGSASGRMTCRTMRAGFAPREDATSSCAVSICENAASSGRITNGVKYVISARSTPHGVVRNWKGPEAAPVTSVHSPLAMPTDP